MAQFAQMDETGIRLRLLRGGLHLADLHHRFVPTPEGTLCRSRLVVGSEVPLLPRLFAEQAEDRGRGETDATGR